MRPLFNEHTESIVTRFFAVVAAWAAAMGVSTQDLAYIAFGALGVMVSVVSFVCGRIDAKHARKEDSKRTAIIAEYAKSAASNGHNPAALDVLIHTLEKARKK
ncbi:hypothetical protein LH23_16160 [Cedecea neteri]|uniref:Holin n=1 Tax=Cedecea neteri TaxID=158822 RepID=A0AAN0S784_9ENTR|nr:hypothetical protein [Cedecea neteri]AIR62130.1 hypothetical protein LH23_16160 [Cedecea neteri]